MRRLRALLFFFIYWGSICALDVPFLSDTLVRKDQLKHVLEHEPAQTASCQYMVRAFLLPVGAMFLALMAAHWPHRDHTMRL